LVCRSAKEYRRFVYNTFIYNFTEINMLDGIV
jgi:hypothetical protein